MNIFKKYQAKDEKNNYLHVIFNREQYHEDIFVNIDNIEIGEGLIRLSPPYYYKYIYYYNNDLGIYADFNYRAFYFEECKKIKNFSISNINRIIEIESLPKYIFSSEEDAKNDVEKQKKESIENKKISSIWKRMLGK